MMKGIGNEGREFCALVNEEYKTTQMKSEGMKGTKNKLLRDYVKVNYQHSQTDTEKDEMREVGRNGVCEKGGK